MRIGIDISQVVYEGTGVGNFMREMVRALLTIDQRNEYILFGSSLRLRHKLEQFYEAVKSPNVKLCIVPIPQTLLDLLWNRLHIISIEMFIGMVDVFWSSDWTQPPLRSAHGITTIHDLTVLRYPESFEGTNIVEVQKRRLAWAKKECRHFFCDSRVTAKDAKELMGIESSTIVYPGL